MAIIPARAEAEGRSCRCRVSENKRITLPVRGTSSLSAHVRSPHPTTRIQAAAAATRTLDLRFTKQPDDSVNHDGNTTCDGSSSSPGITPGNPTGTKPIGPAVMALRGSVAGDTITETPIDGHGGCFADVETGVTIFCGTGKLFGDNALGL